MHVLLLILVLLISQVGFADENLVVHEWGTFTSFQDETGTALSGINTDDESVPEFVHDLSKWLLLKPTEVPPCFFQGAPSCHPDVTMRLETPVIYFHPSKGSDLPPFNVRVQFRLGWLTQFYPDAESDAPGIPSPNQPLNFGPILSSTTGKLSWKLQKLGGKKTGPETTEHVWTAPRAVEAPSIETEKGEVEKFLFYRGVGHIDAPLRISRDKDGKNLIISDQTGSAKGLKGPLKVNRLWLADIRRDGASAFRELSPVTLSGDDPKMVSTTPATFSAKEFALGNLKQLRDSMHGALIKEGLFADEADSLLNTWELSYFKSPGLRLFFIVPRAWTDHYLPLEISVPAEVKRAMVGRIELVMPEQRVLLKKIAAQSASEVEEDRKRLYDIFNLKKA